MTLTTADIKALKQRGFEVTESGVLTKYTGKDKDVIIPVCVTEIGRSAFSGCTSLQSVTVPGSVQSVSEYAFSDCTSLQSVTVPGSVQSVSEYAFSGCTSLQSAVIQDGVGAIAPTAFFNCTSLQSIAIPGSVQSVGAYAFSGCTSLQSAVILDGVGKISYCAFSGCTSLQSAVILDGVGEISYSAFSVCTSLQSIAIPESVQTIEHLVLMSCTGLSTVYCSDRVFNLLRASGADLSSVTRRDLPANGFSKMTLSILPQDGLSPVIRQITHYWGPRTYPLGDPGRTFLQAFIPKNAFNNATWFVLLVAARLDIKANHEETEATQTSDQVCVPLPPELWQLILSFLSFSQKNPSSITSLYRAVTGNQPEEQAQPALGKGASAP